MKRVKEYLNPSLDILGVVLTMFDNRQLLAKQVVEEVENYFGKVMFSTVIPRNVKIAEAPGYAQPITQYAPVSKWSIAYKELAKEVIARG